MSLLRRKSEWVCSVEKSYWASFVVCAVFRTLSHPHRVAHKPFRGILANTKRFIWKTFDTEADDNTSSNSLRTQQTREEHSVVHNKSCCDQRSPRTLVFETQYTSPSAMLLPQALVWPATKTFVLCSFVWCLPGSDPRHRRGIPPRPTPQSVGCSSRPSTQALPKTPPDSSDLRCTQNRRLPLSMLAWRMLLCRDRRSHRYTCHRPIGLGLSRMCQMDTVLNTLGHGAWGGVLGTQVLEQK